MNNISFKEWLRLDEIELAPSLQNPAFDPEEILARQRAAERMARVGSGAAAQRLAGTSYLDTPSVYGAGPITQASDEPAPERKARRTRTKQADAGYDIGSNIPTLSPTYDDQGGLLGLHGDAKKGALRKYKKSTKQSFSQAIGKEHAEKLNSLIEKITGVELSLPSPGWVELIFRHLSRTTLMTDNTYEKYEKALSAIDDFVAEYNPDIQGNIQKFQTEADKIREKMNMKPTTDPAGQELQIKRQVFNMVRKKASAINRADMLQTGRSRWTDTGYRSGITGQHVGDIEDIEDILVNAPETQIRKDARQYLSPKREKAQIKLTLQKYDRLAKQHGSEKAREIMSRNLGIEITPHTLQLWNKIVEDQVNDIFMNYKAQIEAELDDIKAKQPRTARRIEIAKQILPRKFSSQNPITEKMVETMFGVSAGTAHTIMKDIAQAMYNMAGKLEDPEMLSAVTRRIVKDGYYIVNGKISDKPTDVNVEKTPDEFAVPSPEQMRQSDYQAAFASQLPAQTKAAGETEEEPVSPVRKAYDKQFTKYDDDRYLRFLRSPAADPFRRQ